MAVDDPGLTVDKREREGGGEERKKGFAVE